MRDNPDLCLCALLYSPDEYSVQLAARLLNAEFLELGLRADVRLGLNSVSDQTRELVNNRVLFHAPDAVVIDSRTNIGKYPMMRQLFNSRPITAPITMWFDDDSCIVPGTDVNSWFERIKRQLAAFTMLGSVYQHRFLPGQLDWITRQPWYAGITPQPYVKFASGSWWTIRSETIQRLDWPPETLGHKNGDVMLGEAIRQLSERVGHFRDNLWINANEHGVEAEAPRRGCVGPPVGVDSTDSDFITQAVHLELFE